MMNTTNGHTNGEMEQVTVKIRPLVDKVLARYPEQFTVFRELLQNADDAKATSAKIHFRTKDFGTAGAEANGHGHKVVDLSTPVHTWVVSNNGDVFEEQDWSRLRNIADGNPGSDKIGAFGVGFFTVFGMTNEPKVSSGDRWLRMFWEGEQLRIEKGKSSEYSAWTDIEMKLETPKPAPAPFDLTRYLISSMTFLSYINDITIVLDDQVLSRITSATTDPTAIEIPSRMITTSKRETMNIQSVSVRQQGIKAELMQGVSLTSTTTNKKYKPNKNRPETKTDKIRAFFGGKNKKDGLAEMNGSSPSLIEPSVSTGSDSITNGTSNGAGIIINVDAGKVDEYTAQFTKYTTEVLVNPSEQLVAGLKRATNKEPAEKLEFSMTYFSKEEFEKREKENESCPTGSVFQGPAGLFSSADGEFAPRIFIGQGTLQTTGLGAHFGSRFIPTMERGTVDLVNEGPKEWNEELLYVGGFLARLVYETEMNKLKIAWPTNNEVPLQSGVEVDRLKKQGVYVTRFFTGRTSTPDAKIADHIKNAFFNCSSTDDLLILSTHGIHNSIKVRHPAGEYSAFIKNVPLTAKEIGPEELSLLNDLPPNLEIRHMSFKDILDELRNRTLTPQETTPFLRWWISIFYDSANTSDKRAAARNKLFDVATFTIPGTSPRGGGSGGFGGPGGFGGALGNFGGQGAFSDSYLDGPSTGTEDRVVRLSTIKTFVEARAAGLNSAFGSFLAPEDPLPEHTIPRNFTPNIDTETIGHACGWKPLTFLDWLLNMTREDAEQSQSILHSQPRAERMLWVLRNSWAGLPTDQQMKVKELLGGLECIPTNKGMKKPGDAYFPEADIFRDVPVVKLQSFANIQQFRVVFTELGVKRHLDLDVLLARLAEHTDWSVADVVRYLMSATATDPLTDPDAAIAVLKDAPVFFSENEKDKRYPLQELYAPIPENRRLGLPILKWSQGGWLDGSMETGFLYRNGLNQAPNLRKCIELLSDESPAPVREQALVFFTRFHDQLYRGYDPENFKHVRYLPARRGEFECVGSPREVFKETGWADLGFYSVHEKAQPHIVRLKIKDRPTPDLVVAQLREHPPPDRRAASHWFKFLGRRGGLSTTHMAELAELEIIPHEVIDEEQEQQAEQDDVYEVPAEGSSTPSLATKLKYLKPKECYLKAENSPEFYRRIFHYIDLGEHANKFLLHCGAKEEPSCEDIVRTLLRDHERFLEEAGGPNAYLNEMRQISMKYMTLPRDLREELRRFPLFLCYRRGQTTEAMQDVEEATYSFRLAEQIVIADDAESYRLFKQFIFIAPKEPLVEDCYRHFGAKDMSSIVRHDVKTLDHIDSDYTRDIHGLILERLPVFMNECRDRKQLIERKWLADPDNFCVKACKQLTIVKRLDFKHIFEDEYTSEDAKEIVEKRATAGMKRVKRALEDGEEGYAFELWLKGSQKPDMYDVAVALCRVVLENPRMQDSLLLMTLLDTDRDTLQRRGYDIDKYKHVQDITVAEAKREENRPREQREDEHHEDPKPRFEDWRRKFMRFMNRNKKKKRGGPLNVETLNGEAEKALNACTPEDDENINNQEMGNEPKEKHAPDYCKGPGREFSLDKSEEHNGITVYEPPDLELPVVAKFEFLEIIRDIMTDVYKQPLTKFHVFYDSDPELMGFNRSKAIFLNLFYFERHHYRKDMAQAYIVWYFVIAHEIAHNNEPFHDSNHVRLFSKIAEMRFLELNALLEKKDLLKKK